MNQSLECKICCGKMYVISVGNISPQIFECQDCHHREYLEVQFSPPWDIDQNALNTYRILIHLKNHKASKFEIKALREISDELRSLPLKDAILKINESRIFELIQLPLPEAQVYAEKAKKLGLTTTLELCEEDSVIEKNVIGPSGVPFSADREQGELIIIPFFWIIIIIIVLMVLCWFYI